MANCELCGKEDNLVAAFIEGVKLNVCSNCSKHGRVLEERKVIKKIENKIHKEEDIDTVLNDYSFLIKKARENKDLNHHDLALKLNEKESTIAKIEQGNLKPSIELARKFERFFNIKLITKERISEAPTLKSKDTSLTVGDFLKKDE